MARQIINVGSEPLAGDGESIRDALIKTNENFDEVYAVLEIITNDEISTAKITSVPLNSIGSPGDRAGMISVDNNYFYYCISNYDGVLNIWKRSTWNVDTWSNIESN